MATQTATKVLAIDTVVNIPNPNRERHHEWILHERPGFGDRESNMTPERFIEKMDAAGIEKSFLIASKHGSIRVGSGCATNDSKTPGNCSPRCLRRRTRSAVSPKHAAGAAIGPRRFPRCGGRLNSPRDVWIYASPWTGC